MRWLLGASLATAGACGQGRGVHPLPLAPGAGDVASDPLSQAIAQYRRTGSAVAIEAFIAAHPEDDRSSVWHELLALRAYDEAFELGEQSVDGYDPAPLVSATELRSVLSQYPGTFAAQMAGAGLDTGAVELEIAALQSLATPPLNPRAIRFLDGDEGWAEEVGAEPAVQIDPEAFRRRHEAGIKAAIRRAVLADGCRGSMGYCTWFALRFPDDPGATEVAAAMKAVWYQRAHPPWRGREQLQCAFSCAQGCRASAAPLDDSCYDPCYSAC